MVLGPEKTLVYGFSEGEIRAYRRGCNLLLLRTDLNVGNIVGS